MRKTARPLHLLALLLAVSGQALGVSAFAAVPSATPATAESNAAAWQALMRQHKIPGAQVVHVRDGRVQAHVFGAIQAEESRPVQADTLFQAASLSKVVGAYLTLRLVDQGVLDLDRPLWQYWASPRIRDNPQAQRITARMVLNHTSGLKNWQVSPSNPAIFETPLENLFAPGERYSYSGEGFFLLQRTLEHVTGKRWEQLARAEVFERFDMSGSRYLTDAGTVARNARGHDEDGQARAPRMVGWENTAWSLVTTAGEYSRFLQRGVFRGEGLSPASHALLKTVSSDADDRDVPVPVDPYIAWSQGVGLQIVDGRTRLWHWGDNPGFKAFFMLDAVTGESLVLLTNSQNGLATYKQVLRLFMGEGEYPAVDWAQSQS